MTKFLAVTSLAFTLLAAPALAGGLSDPEVEPPVMEKDTMMEKASTSDHGILVPIFALIMLAATASN
ncbi:MAG: hypothetical protein AAGD04_16425 [Pseudomonadota bacterium]